MVRPVSTVDVTPNLPPSLERLRDLPGLGRHTAQWLRDHSGAIEPRQPHGR